ncbi:MAG: RNA polymerase sigma factor [Roseitalea sp.]|uniref:RNA polymerase sigma factor n=1 Tax=Oceaniradius stylonematis TaxID=2184161 RepID=UPI001B259640|nr:RNA polymerase sigma factor [Roseitalea sp.]MBO6951574.1 RNA polymerase sigma factor [Rhizobiaceae bacterium]MBO6592580.1 RNA polymerase sigma factor [Roseitalea sp.]MBO6598835.1 RNA polymerase sigma factor [Roseitalea sp.]MBO6611281.1 RNA polymerase sigma factor [Roseitalea sp.]
MHAPVRQNVPKPHDNPIHDRLLECRREFLNYFRRRLNRPEDAEDAFQDFCLKVIRSAEKLDDAARTDAWLRCILRNTLIDHYRRRAARLRCDEAYKREPQPTALDPDPMNDVAISCRCVRDGLTTLRCDYAEILKRADLDQEPRSQIAEDLGLTANNVGVRLHRARRALKASIKQYCPICADGRFAECDC